MATTEALALPPEMLVTVERFAVYRCFSDSGELLYIGYSGELGKRLAAHAQKLWFTQVRGITLEWYTDELDARNAERRAIHVEHPKYNQVHRNVPRLAPLPSSPQPRRKAAPARRAALPMLEQARNLLAADPSLREPRMGGELARRLGVSGATGRRLLARLAAGEHENGRRQPQDIAAVPEGGSPRDQALSVYLADPTISGAQLGPAVGMSKRWGQDRMKEFKTSVVGGEAAPSDS